MFNEVIKKFKAWITREDVDSLTRLLSKFSLEIDDFANSLESRIKHLEAAEKSRAGAMDFIASSTEEIKPVCDDCISMRLEMDAIKLRLESVENAIKRNGSDSGGGESNVLAGTVSNKPKRGRRKNDAKELVA
jgi:hypothetical protein